MRFFILSALTFFCVLIVFFLPFSYSYLTVQERISNFLFSDFVYFLSKKLGKTNLDYTSFSSDSYSMFILVFFLLFVAIILAFLQLKIPFLQKNSSKIRAFSSTLITFYLVLHLANYGFDKVFKSQFYLPEPNILYTPFGSLDKDILYWSTMGISYGYNLFLGSLEIITAALIFFKRTRIIGLILAVSIFVQVIAINFSFDISVKLFSLLLLLFSLILLAPNLRSILQFLLKNDAKKLEEIKTLIPNKKVGFVWKSFFVIFLFTQTLLPNILANNFNDDKQERPFLHGAYEVIEAKGSPLKRIFFHRDGYLILQYEDETMLDFKASINQLKQEITLIDYDNKTLIMKYELNTDNNQLSLVTESFLVKAKTISWQDLPVLQDNFQWSIDH